MVLVVNLELMRKSEDNIEHMDTTCVCCLYDVNSVVNAQVLESKNW